MAQKFEFEPGTETLQPQIRNEHLGTEEEVAAAHKAVDEWYAEHEKKLEAAKAEEALK